MDMVHGRTVATNAILELKGGKTGLILFIIQGIAKEPLLEVVKGVFSFTLILFAIIAFPELALIIPATM